MKLVGAVPSVHRLDERTMVDVEEAADASAADRAHAQSRPLAGFVGRQ
jgi:hypothetical protein